MTAFSMNIRWVDLRRESPKLRSLAKVRKSLLGKTTAFVWLPVTLHLTERMHRTLTKRMQGVLHSALQNLPQNAMG
jgi:hypothetical protein